MNRQRSIVQRMRTWRPSGGDLFAWTATTLMFWLIVAVESDWTVEWWAERRHVVIGLLILTLGTVCQWTLRAARGLRRDDKGAASAHGVEVPKLGRLQVCAYPCHVCGAPLKDGDLTVHVGTRLGHARCMVLVQERDGTHVSGERGRAVMFLYADEWDAWIKSDGQQALPFRPTGGSSE